MRAYTLICTHVRVYASIYAHMLAYTRICMCFASRKCDDAAATLKSGHLVTPGLFLSDAAASHTNETPFGHWDTLPPLTVPRRLRPQGPGGLVSLDFRCFGSNLVHFLVALRVHHWLTSIDLDPHGEFASVASPTAQASRQYSSPVVGLSPIHI